MVHFFARRWIAGVKPTNDELRAVQAQRLPRRNHRLEFCWHRLVTGPGDAYLQVMDLSCLKGFIAALAIIAIARVDIALAQNRHGVPKIMVDVDEHGTPVIMEDSSARSKKPEAQDRQSKQAERPRRTPRGSGAYVAPIPLPRTGRDAGIAALPPAAPYIPPPIDNPSERINQLNHSFPLNRGLGLNPTDRDASIRYNLNR